MRDVIEALLGRVSDLPDGNAWPSTIELICDMADALKTLAEENERLKIERDEAREQFDSHVAWASDQQAAAEARAIAAEEALKPFAYAAFEADDYPDNEAFTIALRPDNFEIGEEGEQESLITARQLRAARAALAQKEGG